MYHRFFKRLFDLLLAGGSLLMLSPLMLLTALAVRLDDGGSSLFRQKRVGHRGGLFQILKFRSLPANTKNLPSVQAQKIAPTRVGKIIRRTNIDELPQLINVLNGEMSIVGPRPALPSQEQLVILRKANGALRCKPGLTGLAQVSSYDGMPESEKAKWDGEYASRITLFRDLTIILKTFIYLTRRPPVY
jgi:O-antigen biosynthesis protein WbqP